MPKVGLTDNEWRARLRDYAAGKFKFSKGQHPRPSSKWAASKEKIDKYAFNYKDIYSRPVNCNCGYHTVRKINF